MEIKVINQYTKHIYGGDMPKDLTVTALAMWGLFALGVIVGTCYCYYSDNHIDEKLG